MRLILGSQSISRRQVLEMIGLEFEVIPSHIDEDAIQNEDPAERARILSVEKAKEVAKSNSDALIITADLFVVFNGKYMEKPKTQEEGMDMLRTLSGQTFEMVSGLTVYNSSINDYKSSKEICEITFREISENEINLYASKHDLTKYAAAFGGDGITLFASKFIGDYNATGFSVANMMKFLREFGYEF